MSTTLRTGAIGAMLDEYERAAAELYRLVESLPEADYLRIDPTVTDEDCRSVQTILSHVVGAGYSYAFYIRQALGMEAERPARPLLSQAEALAGFRAMLAHTAQSLEGRWQMPYQEMESIAIQSRWGPTYNLEQMLEHAIVHILRHRRQIEKIAAVSTP